MPVAVSRAAIRAARSAAGLPLEMTAAAAGTSTSGAARRLRALQGRGVCAQNAAAAASQQRSEWSRCVVLGHWACPPAARRAAGVDSSASVQAAAAHLVTDVSRVRVAAGRMRTRPEMTKTMKDPDCPPAVLRVLAAGRSSHGLSDRERFHAAVHAVSHPAAPLDLLWRAAHSKYLQHSAAQHRSCPPRVLRLLSRASAVVRIAVAANPACQPGVIEELVTDPDSRVRSAAISNPSLPAAVLVAVSDPAAGIDNAVSAAANPNSGPGLARRLAASDDNSAAVAAALIPECPIDVLESLATRGGETLQSVVAAHAACPVDVLAKAARSRWSSVIKAVAGNLSCPPETLRRLSPSRRAAICRAVAGNLNCPPDVLGELLNDSVFNVAKAAAANPNCPNSALVDATRLGAIANRNMAVAALRSRMRVWPGAAPRSDV